MKKKLSMIMAVLMIIMVFLSSCSGSGEESEQSSKAEESVSSAAESASDSESSEEEEAAEGMAEDNGVKFYVEGTHVVDDEVELSCMQYIRDTDAVTMDGLWWVDHLYETTGVKINYSQVNNSDWSTQINLTFASGEYPDLLVGTNKIDMEIYGVDQGILRQFDDLIQYMPTYKERIEADPVYAYPIYASDGHMYCMGGGSDSGVRISASPFFINRKWLDAVGMEVPTTTDELLEVLRAFRTQDPNGNGDPSDEIGYEGVFDDLTTFMFYMWGIPEVSQHIMIDDDGTVVFLPFTEHYREAVEYFATMYAENLMDPEVITQDANSRNAAYNTNNIGFATLNRKKSMGWDILIDDMEFMMPPVADGCQVRDAGYVAAASAKAFITSTNPYPAISARWMDAQLDNQLCWENYYGPEGVLWSYNDEGKCEVGPEGDQGVMEYALGVCGLYYLPGYMYNDVFQQPDYRLERLEYSNKYIEAGYVNKYPITYATSFAKFTVDEANERTEIFANIESIYDQNVAEMLMHGVTDDTWNKLIDELKGCGAERYTELYQKGVTELIADLGV